MLENYFPVLLFVLVGLAVGIGPMLMGGGVSRLLGVHRPDSEKLSPYECGFEAFEDARMKFDVRYYLVAILFILFDLEIAFLFPWAVVLDDIGLFGFVAMMIFLGILVVGFIYEWKKGALEWEKRRTQRSRGPACLRGCDARARRWWQWRRRWKVAVGVQGCDAQRSMGFTLLSSCDSRDGGIDHGCGRRSR